MSRTVWPLLVLGFVALAAYAMLAVAPSHAVAADARSQATLHGLDYLHARQEADAGFGSMPNTVWAILGLVASGERAGSQAWKVSGDTPFTYLDARSHEAAATAGDVDNAPIYYARAIMSYVAAQQKARVFTAGTPRVDLLAKLYAYQDEDEGATLGSFSPSSSNRDFQAVRTTAWALLAMRTMGESSKDRFTAAASWLVKQQNDDGGFPVESTVGETSNCQDTAMVVQALVASSNAITVDPAILEAASDYLKSQQLADGGFPSAPGGKTDAMATAAVIQAIVALGDDPNDSEWTSGTHTATGALRSLQLSSGAFVKKIGSTLQMLPTTSWALVALAEKPFTAFPATIGTAATPFVARPTITSASPKNKAKFTSTNVVVIEASYNDGKNGTGIKTSACKVFIDDVDKSKPASIGSTRLRLRLSNVANGTHSYKLVIADRAGNVRTLQRTFTVAVPTAPVATPTAIPTYPFIPTTPTATPTPTTPLPVTTLTPQPTTTPTTTAYPFPSQSGVPVSGSGVLSPSPSSSAVPASSGYDDGAWYIGGILLAMLPLGAAGSYALHRWRINELEDAPASNPSKSPAGDTPAGRPTSSGE
ncbi:MAG: prenyltransferase/squalene oxidase repeat-containing protein [Thermoleophilia bacterium]